MQALYQELSIAEAKPKCLSTGEIRTWITLEVGNTLESSLLLVHVDNSCSQANDQELNQLI